MSGPAPTTPLLSGRGSESAEEESGRREPTEEDEEIPSEDEDQVLASGFESGLSEEELLGHRRGFESGLPAAVLRAAAMADGFVSGPPAPNEAGGPAGILPSWVDSTRFPARSVVSLTVAARPRPGLDRGEKQW